MMMLLQLFHVSHKHSKQTKVCSCFKDKTLWDWLELLIVPLILGLMTILWNHRVDQQATDKEQGQLVRNYINSITTLILDQYHHGKVDKFPEISVQEVESFVRAKTANTLQALNESDKKHKQNLINFLSEAGIGFFPPYKSDAYDSKLLIQNICPSGDTNVANHIISQEKDITFHDFFCKIELSNVVLNDLDLRAVIWEGANLYKAEMKGAILEQANFQGAWLNQVDLTDANLNKANLKGAFLQESTLENAQLNQANLRGAKLGRSKGGDTQLNPTNLGNAELRGVNLGEAQLGRVNFKNAIMEPFCVTKKGKEEQKCTKEIAEREILTNLRNAKLQGSNLKGVNLKRANLRNTNLQNTNIDQALTLEGAIVDNHRNFPKSIKESDKFIKDNEIIKIHPELGTDEEELENLKKWGLSDVDLRGADLTNANLSGVDLRRADLRGAKMSNAILEGANLRYALYDDKTELPDDFGSNQKEKDAEARLSQGMIKIESGSDLREKDIRYADLSGVDLRNTKLQGAKLSNIDFDDDTQWKNAQFDSKTELPFDKNTAIRYGMKYAPYPPHLNWEGENHQKANLQNAILKNGKFKDVIFKKAQLQKADLTETDLTHADLTGANLSKANLTDVKLGEADLTDANLRGVIVTDEQKNPEEQRKQKENFEAQLKDVVLCRTALPNFIDETLKKEAKTRDCLKKD